MDGIYPIEYFIASYCKLNLCPTRNIISYALISMLDRIINDILTDTLTVIFAQNFAHFFEWSFDYFLHNSSLLTNRLFPLPLPLTATTTSNSLNLDIISDVVESEHFKIFLTSDAPNT